MIDMDNISIEFLFSEKEAEKIKKNLSLLYRTQEGTQPLDREFGLARNFLSKQMNVAENEFVLEVTEKTEIYEPRVRVSDVTFTAEPLSGKLQPTIFLEKGDDEEDELYGQFS